VLRDIDAAESGEPEMCLGFRYVLWMRRFGGKSVEFGKRQIWLEFWLCH